MNGIIFVKIFFSSRRFRSIIYYEKKVTIVLLQYFNNVAKTLNIKCRQLYILITHQNNENLSTIY